MEHNEKIVKYEEKVQAVLMSSQRVDEGFKLCSGNWQLFQRSLGYTVSGGSGAPPVPVASVPAAGGSGVLGQTLGLPPVGSVNTRIRRLLPPAGGSAATVHAAPIELAEYKGGLDVISDETKYHLNSSRFFDFFELRAMKEDGKQPPVILQAQF
jgi:hypothetical protein